MNFNNDNVIEEIKLKADIVNVIGEFLPLKKKGRNFIGNCPFHNEKTPSFVVSQEKQIYHCFGCNASGNIFTFLMEHENMTFTEALKYLADKYEVQLQNNYYYQGKDRFFNSERDEKKERNYTIHQFVARYYYKKLYDEYGKEALAYARKRGLSKETLDKFKIGYAPYKSDELVEQLIKLGYSEDELTESGIFSKGSDGRIYSKFFNRLIFPIDNVKDRIIGFGGRILAQGEPKYLNSPETEIFKKKYNLYALNNAKEEIRKKNQILLMEGYMDVISVWQKGVCNAVASLGTSLTEEQCKLMLRYANEIVLVYDSDKAGQKATIRALEILRPFKAEVKVAELKGSKDPDEYIIKYGLNSFSERIRESKSSFIYLMDLVKSKYNIEKPEDKIKGIRYLLPELMSKEDPLLKNEYLGILSQEFNIEKDDLKNIIFKNSNKIPQTDKKSLVKEKKINMDDEQDKAEIDVLKIVINQPELTEYIKAEDIDFFLNSFIKETLNSVMEHYKDGSKSVKDMLLVIDNEEIKNFSVYLALKNDGFTLDETDFIEYLNKVKKIFYKRKIDDIIKNIKLAEKEGNKDLCVELQNEWYFYNNKLNSIQGGS